MGDKGQIFGIIILLLFLFTLYPADCTQASPITSVSLSFDGEPPTVDVSPGSSGIVEIEALVTCEKYGPDEVKVSLTGQCDMGGVSCDPPNMVFGGLSGSVETRPVSVSTRVPQGSSSELEPEIMVSGIYVQGGLQYPVEPISVPVIILQYYKISYHIEDRSISVRAGEGRIIDFVVFNLGNGDDSFLIDFDNRQDLEMKGFEMTAPFETFRKEGENSSVSLTVKAPSGASGRHMGYISILSKGSVSDEQPVEVMLSVRIDVSGDIGGNIGSFFTSPLGILLIIGVVGAAIYVKIRKGKKISSGSD